MTDRRLVATRGDQLIRGVGVVSDENGGTRLRFRIDNIAQPVTLNTREWHVEAEDEASPVPPKPNVVGLSDEQWDRIVRETRRTLA